MIAVQVLREVVMRIAATLTMTLAAVCLCGSLVLGISAAKEEKSPVSAAQALQLLKEGNERYAADRLEQKDIGQKRRLELVQGQHPFAVVVTCADSRVPPELIFNQGLGDVFVLRVAGNIADPFILGSIEYAVEHLHAPLVVVLGHDHCGAVAAALNPHKPSGNLGMLISHVFVGKELPKATEAMHLAAVKNNVLHQAAAVTAHSEVLKKAAEEEQVRIEAAVYHLESGKVEWLEKK
jgi:carbonic anhydrase